MLYLPNTEELRQGDKHIIYSHKLNLDINNFKKVFGQEDPNFDAQKQFELFIYQD